MSPSHAISLHRPPRLSLNRSRGPSLPGGKEYTLVSPQTGQLGTWKQWPSSRPVVVEERLYQTAVPRQVPFRSVLVGLSPVHVVSAATYRGPQDAGCGALLYKSSPSLTAQPSSPGGAVPLSPQRAVWLFHWVPFHTTTGHQTPFLQITSAAVPATARFCNGRQ